MGSYPLEMLLTVRRHREDAAANNVKRAESSLKAAEQLAETRRSELAQYQAWRSEETERRYEAIMGSRCTLKELDDFRAGLAALDAREAMKAEAAELAARDAEMMRGNLEKARAAARAAQKERAKIQAHKDIWTEGDKKEAERKEDLELEEFRPVFRQGAEGEDE
ncbi:MAG: YscO family type III secretion system apparatus protein [Desulfovibrionaceae bacterium]|nr:YscO family type III secretion system apparatus protein [Desulfovibrionaceae bacterium]